ncbi:dynein intermediate chain, putative, partial [Aspergillus lentulus]
MSSVQQRKAEILAKRAKLAELRRQRELRQKEFSQSRASTGGDASE